MADGFDTIPCEHNQSDCQEVSQYTFDTQIGSAYNVSRAIAEQWKVIDELKEDVIEVADKTAVKDYNGNVFTDLTLKGENGINIDLDETEPNTLDIRLDQDVIDQIGINMENIDLLGNDLSDLDTRVTNTEESITELAPDVARALKIPMSTPWVTKLVAVNTTNTQEMLQLSDSDFYLDGGVIRLKNILLEAYPIGSIYISAYNTSPASFIGGTWEKIPEKYALWTTNETITNEGEASAWNGVGVRRLKNALPNIKGTIGGNYGGYITANFSSTGALQSNGTSGVALPSGSGQERHYLGFNAYYGDDSAYQVYRDEVDYVQPPAYKVHAWKRVS